MLQDVLIGMLEQWWNGLISTLGTIVCYTGTYCPVCPPYYIGTEAHTKHADTVSVVLVWNLVLKRQTFLGTVTCPNILWDVRDLKPWLGS